MKKYDLLRASDSIIRVLEIQGDRVLIIDCIKRTMPRWAEIVSLGSYSDCTNDGLVEVTGVAIADVETLDAEQRKVMYERYTMIAPILSFVSDDRMRSQLIGSIATENGVSKQTVRNYLCLYLSYLDVAALAPHERQNDRKLTIDEKNIRWALGRPILTACIDAYSGLCCGYSLSWEGGVYSLRGLMLNIISDKVAWCNRFVISIQKDDWDCDMLPATFVTDMGSEYKSENFEQIAELGVTVINLPSYRPELKGLVEKFFDLIQESYKKHLKGKGVIEPDYQERGAHDYRRDACLTMTDFEKIVFYNVGVTSADNDIKGEKNVDLLVGNEAVELVHNEAGD